jgi:hypothetical protein
VAGGGLEDLLLERLQMSPAGAAFSEQQVRIEDRFAGRAPARLPLQRSGGRKLVVTPERRSRAGSEARRDETLVKALVGAHRWRRRIESGRAKSITDLAEQEGVTDAYLCRLLPLTCLAPDIVKAVLDGRQPKGLRLAEMLGNGSLVWEDSERTGASLRKSMI